MIKIKIQELIKELMLKYEQEEIRKVSPINRTHLSNEDRISGYWSWNVSVVRENGNQCLIGSSERVQDILTAKKELLKIAEANAVGFEIVLNGEKTGETK